MSLGGDTPPDGSPDPLDLLRHDGLKTPLVTIHSRAQLLARSIQRSPSLADEERVRMLAGLTSIVVAVGGRANAAASPGERTGAVRIGPEPRPSPPALQPLPPLLAVAGLALLGVLAQTLGEMDGARSSPARIAVRVRGRIFAAHA